MTLFLDTEFNGFDGQLISIALVSDEGGRGSEFYAVCELPERVTPFVLENVLLHLDKRPEPETVVRGRLLDFLHKHQQERIIADWPHDFIHLLQLLCVPGGRAHVLGITMQLVSTDNLESDVPHNALSDARALMRWYNGAGRE